MSCMSPFMEIAISLLAVPSIYLLSSYNASQCVLSTMATTTFRRSTHCPCYLTTKRSHPFRFAKRVCKRTRVTPRWTDEAYRNDVRHVADRRPFYTDPLPLELLRITIVYVLPRLPCCVLACVCVAYSLLTAGVHAIVSVRFSHGTVYTETLT